MVKAGRALAKIHLHYEEQDAPECVEVIGSGDYLVNKLCFDKDDRTTLIYSEFITAENIPPRRLEYVVKDRIPIEWIVDR